MIRARLALLALAIVAAAGAKRLPIQVYSVANGMPSNSARCMVPDPAGLLWICTAEGLVRFDGYVFRTFGVDQGLPSHNILDFRISKKGGYWLVTDLGVCRLPAGSRVGDPCRVLAVDSRAGEYQPESLAEADDGATWVATAKAVYRVSADGRRLERTAAFTASYLINCIALGPDGSLLIGTEKELIQWREGQPPRTLTSQSVPYFNFPQILVQPSGVVWLPTGLGLVRVTGIGGPRNPVFQTIPLQPAGNPARVLCRRDGSVWVARWEGISVVAVAADGKATEVEHYTTREGLPDRYVNQLAEDRQGNLWGATDGSGIFRIANAGFTTWNEGDGLGSARISSIFETVQGDLFVTTSVVNQQDTPYRVKVGNRFEPIVTRYPPGQSPSGWGWNQFGLQAHDGEWWFPSSWGLYRFSRTLRPQGLNGRMPDRTYAMESLGGMEVFRVFEDSQGDMWISLLYPRNELVRWERKTGIFRHWTSADGWPDNEVPSVIREAPSGTHWVATFEDVVRFRNARFEVLPVLPRDQPAYVRDLLIDSRGRIWLATARNGLYRCDNPEDATPVFRDYTTREGLSSDSVRAVIEDNDGFIYAATIRGVDRIDPRSPVDAHHILTFGPSDGLPISDNNVAFRDRRGHLWFGTLHGLAEFDPSAEPKRSPPDVYVTRLRSRGVDVPLPWAGARNFSMALGSDRNQLEVEYAGVDLRSVASLRYQYRLVGVDNAWSPPVDRLSVNYASLPSGKLRFEVRAVTGDGQMSWRPAGFDLAVEAPLWRRAWFLVLAAVMIVALGTALYNYRVRQLLAMERLRTRIATDLHDDIGASLTQISILSELARRSPGREVLDDVAGIARGLVQDMSDIVWAVNPRHDRFDDLVHRMRRFASDTLSDLELRFDTAHLPADIVVPLDCRRPLYLVFKEAVNNVARHSEATRAEIHITVEESWLKLVVEDNGRGFDPAAPRRSGEGLNSIRKRLRDVSGRAEWESASGRGTRFTAALPLHRQGALHKLGGIFAGSHH
jgi:signal transduction histidine kinase/ligand-binding sensor domain-containing protein